VQNGACQFTFFILGVSTLLCAIGRLEPSFLGYRRTAQTVAVRAAFPLAFPSICAALCCHVRGLALGTRRSFAGLLNNGPAPLLRVYLSFFPERRRVLLLSSLGGTRRSTLFGRVVLCLNSYCKVLLKHTPKYSGSANPFFLFLWFEPKYFHRYISFSDILRKAA
jgi:hypothetical protein